MHEVSTFIKNRKQTKLHENFCKNYDYCYTKMHEKDDKTIKYSHEEKTMKFSFAVYAETELQLEEIDKCYSNPEKSSAAKANKCGYSLFIYCSFDSNKNKHDSYIGEDCIKNFCKKSKIMRNRTNELGIKRKHYH